MGIIHEFSIIDTNGNHVYYYLESSKEDAYTVKVSLCCKRKFFNCICDFLGKEVFLDNNISNLLFVPKEHNAENCLTGTDFFAYKYAYKYLEQQNKAF